MQRIDLAGAADQPWMARARCAGADTSDFYPEDGSPPKVLALCRECEVQPDCLEYALRIPERFGVWGGMTEGERARLRRSRCRQREEDKMAPMAAKVDTALEITPPTSNGSSAAEGAEQDAPRRCDWCHEPLKPTARPNQRWCSRTCSNRAVEARRQAATVAVRQMKGRTGDELDGLIRTLFDAGAVLELELAGVRITARR